MEEHLQDWRKLHAETPWPQAPSDETPVAMPAPALTPEGYPIPDFTPFVPQRRRRYGGWSADAQRAFIAALTRMGHVGAAARAAGRTARSAYLLRDKDGAESFAAAWDAAANFARGHARDASLDLALNGEAIPVYRRGRFAGWRVKRDWRALQAVMVAPDDHARNLDQQRWRLERWEVALRREALDRAEGVPAADASLAEAEEAARIAREEAARFRRIETRRRVREAVAAAAARENEPKGPRIRMI